MVRKWLSVFMWKSPWSLTQEARRLQQEINSLPGYRDLDKRLAKVMLTFTLYMGIALVIMLLLVNIWGLI